MGVEGVKHNHGPTEWCSKCPREWLQGEVESYTPSPSKQMEFNLKDWIIQLPNRFDHSPPNITRLSPSRITTEFGSIRP